MTKCQAHSLKVAGSNPALAIMKILPTPLSFRMVVFCRCAVNSNNAAYVLLMANLAAPKLKGKRPLHPRNHILSGPTPLKRARELSKHLAIELFIKRNDLAGPSLTVIKNGS